MLKMNSAVEPIKALPAAEPSLVFGGIHYQERDERNSNASVTQSEYEDESLDTSSIGLRSPRTPIRWSPSLSRAYRDRYCNRSTKLRTPRTMTRLMQQHRDNERHRHRGLNASIKDITCQIPGFETAAKETKIVKLQRIIHYICHLEGHIQGLCQELAVGLQYKNLFLSPHLPKKNEAKKRKLMSGPSPSKPSKTKVMKTGNRNQHVSSSTDVPDHPAAASKGENLPFSQRLKVSSPTIDSTTDEFFFNIVPKELELPLLADDEPINEDIKPIDLTPVKPEALFDMCTEPKPGSSHVAKDAVLTDAWECLSDTSEPQEMTEDDNPESWVDNEVPDLPFHAYDDLLTVFPREMNLDSPSKAKFSPINKSPSYLNRNKPVDDLPGQLTPKSTPKTRYTAVTDYAQKNDTLNNDIDENSEPFPVLWESKEQQETQKLTRLPCTSFVKVLPEKQSKSTQSIKPATGIVQDKGKSTAACAAPPTDLRKTSWMNGFMMFSRMHRKDYIQSHPGTPTNYISKIMGQDWRQLSSPEKDVYREYAKTHSMKFLQG